MLSDFIKKLKTLRTQAGDNYRAIEAFYNKNSQGKSVDVPMNVQANFPGSSSDPSHNNAWEVAAIYCDLYRIDKVLDQVNMLEELLAFFGRATSLDPELPEQFTESIDEFHQNLNELYTELTQSSQPSINIEKRELFRQQISVLIAQDYDPYLVQNAFCMMVEEKQESTPALSFLKLLQLQQLFSTTLAAQQIHESRSYLTEPVLTQEVPEEEQGLEAVIIHTSQTTDKKTRELANYLRALVNVSLVNEFVDTFNKLHYQFSLKQAISSSQHLEAWHRDGFTCHAETKDREEHREKYRAVCDEILRRENIKCRSRNGFFSTTNTQDMPDPEEHDAEDKPRRVGGGGAIVNTP